MSALLSGPPNVRAIKGFHDESLSGQWKGYRSFRPGLKWSVIDRAVASVLVVERAKVLPEPAADLERVRRSATR
jgi:hypothetical protein